MSPRVYLIILNWNGWQDTVRCLQSVIENSYPNYRVIVCDNNSTDGSLREIKEWLDHAIGEGQYVEYDRGLAEEGGLPEKEKELEGGLEVVLIKTGANLGFAGGNNVGLRYALKQKSDYIWLLNNDTEIDPEALTKMVEVMEGQPRVGMAGSCIYHREQRSRLLFAGGRIIWPMGRCFNEMNTGLAGVAREIDFVTGCSLLTRREVVEEVGLLDEKFFLYYEDTDWCRRAVKAGHSLAYVPEATVYHDESSSMSALSAKKQYYCTRNNLLFMKKHAPWHMWATFIPFFIAKLMIKAAMFTLKGNPSMIKSLAKGVGDFLKGSFGKRL